MVIPKTPCLFELGCAAPREALGMPRTKPGIGERERPQGRETLCFLPLIYTPARSVTFCASKSRDQRWKPTLRCVHPIINGKAK